MLRRCVRWMCMRRQFRAYRQAGWSTVRSHGPGSTNTGPTTAARISSLLGIVVSASWLAYWTGRRYKEVYFAQFGINYEILGFETPYFLFASWFTILAAISTSMVLVLVITSIFTQDRRAIVFSALVLAFSAIVALWWPEPDTDGLHAFFCSKDRLFVLMGIAAAGGLWVIVRYNAGVREVVRTLESALEQDLLISATAIFFMVWFVMLLSAEWAGAQHAHSAISHGGMDISRALVGTDTLLYVTRTSDGRNFLYDPSTE